jgi:hypothetical protein
MAMMVNQDLLVLQGQQETEVHLDPLVNVGSKVCLVKLARMASLVRMVQLVCQVNPV